MKFTICSIKNSLNAAINSVASNQNLYAKNPNKDFSRVRKLPFNDLIRMIISSGGKSNNKELLDFFHFSPSLASSSAFVQARGKILPQAFYDVFHNFTYSALSAKKFCDYRLLAVDGSDLTIPTNYKDAESFVKSTPRDYNILHINALFDLHNRIYLDASVQKLRNKNEHLALCSMIDNSPINDKAVIIADRGYESYNNMAHIELKNWKYVIRVKETNGIISKLLLPEKE